MAHEAEDARRNNQRYLRYGRHELVTRLRRRSRDLAFARSQTCGANRLTCWSLRLRNGSVAPEMKTLGGV